MSSLKSHSMCVTLSVQNLFFLNLYIDYIIIKLISHSMFTIASWPNGTLNYLAFFREPIGTIGGDIGKILF